MYYVYVLVSEKNKTLYVGYTTNTLKRLNQHNNGDAPSTKRYRLWRLVYAEGYFSDKDAKKREITLKNHGRSHAQLKIRIEESILGALR